MSATFSERPPRPLNPATVLAPVNRLITRAICEVSAETLGLYRIAFAALFLYFWVGYDPSALARIQAGSKFALTDVEFLRYLSSSETARILIYNTVTVSAWLVLVGLFSRAAYVCFAVSFWLAALLTGEGHSLTPLLLAVAVGLPARWGDGLSLDRWLGISKPIEGRSLIYGYPAWLMGLCIALAYASAGVSKLVLTDGAWIWGTGARWGFVSDLRVAATDWGLMFVNNYWLAVFASIIGGIGQVVYLYSCFTRSARIKGAIGLLVAFPFLIGLMLFMGLFWWQWAILVILLYVPWPLLGRWIDRPGTTSDGGAGFAQHPFHRRWAVVIAWALLVSHGVVVFQQREYEPFLSNYPMYAMTFPMGSDYEQKEWENYKKHDRHFVLNAKIEGDDTESLNSYLWFSPVLENMRLPSPRWAAPVRSVASLLAENKPIPESLCSAVKILATSGRQNDQYLVISRHTMTWWTASSGSSPPKKVHGQPPIAGLRSFCAQPLNSSTAIGQLDQDCCKWTGRGSNK